MRFLHISDLHLGRRLHEVSLLEDQQFILQQILDLIDEKKPHAILIAGDVYDKAVPAGEAVRLLDWFLTMLANREIPVFLVSGNHDSAERLSFAAKLLNYRNIFVSSLFEKPEPPVILQDEYGEVRVHLLPFVKPVHVRRAIPDAEISNYTDAIAAVINAWNLDVDQRNILVAHQFVTGAVRSESETVSIGGLDDVSGEVLAEFDYVALGHLHRQQKVGQDQIRYSGTPLAYSFSEGDQEKSVTWIDLGAKGDVSISQTVLHPLHPVSTRRGLFEDVLKDSSEDYLRIILTDDDDVPNALARLRYRYPNLLRLEYDNIRTRMMGLEDPAESEHVSPIQLLEEFYRSRNGKPMDESQRQLALSWMEEIWEGEP